MEPEQSPTPSPVPQINEGAGFWIRAGARIIDSIYGIVLSFFAGILGGIVFMICEQSGVITPGWEHRVGGFNFTELGCSLLGNFVYHSLTEGMYGASLGKLICQLRVVTEEGDPIGITRAAKRSLLYFFDALFFGLIAYHYSMKHTPLNQRLGDHWAHTVVVPKREVPAESRQSPVIFLLALLIGSTCWIIFNALGLVLHAR